MEHRITMNDSIRIENPSRRDFLKQGGGLTLALVLPGVAAAAGAGPGIAGTAPVVSGDFSPTPSCASAATTPLP